MRRIGRVKLRTGVVAVCIVLGVVAVLGLSCGMTSNAFAISSGAPSDQVTPAPGKANDDVWPKPVEDFLAGDYLRLADVVLTRRSGDIASTIIQWATESAFSHAAMIYTSERFDAGISGTFVIEAGTSGVDLTKLSDYAESKGTYVAIKRLRSDWFTPAMQARTRGVLLDKIKDSYDFWTILRIARNIWFGVQSKMNTREKAVASFRQRNWQPPNEYICSGLVQIGFVQSAIENIENGTIPPEDLLDVVFTKSAEGRLPERGYWKYLGPQGARDTARLFQQVLNNELYSITPEDLAQTDKLEWLYLIKDGKVYKVSSYSDVLKLVN